MLFTNSIPQYQEGGPTRCATTEPALTTMPTGVSIMASNVLSLPKSTTKSRRRRIIRQAMSARGSSGQPGDRAGRGGTIPVMSAFRNLADAAAFSYHPAARRAIVVMLKMRPVMSIIETGCRLTFLLLPLYAGPLTSGPFVCAIWHMRIAGGTIAGFVR
jgi:hypothetical protein